MKKKDEPSAVRKFFLTKSEHQNGTERCAEAAQTLELDSNDIVVDIQGDEPLLNPNDINNLIKNNQANLLTSAKDIVKMLNWDIQEKPKSIQKQLFI